MHVLIHVCDPIPAIAIPVNLTSRNVNKTLFISNLYNRYQSFFLNVQPLTVRFLRETSVLSFKFYLMFERYFNKHVDINIDFSLDQ